MEQLKEKLTSIYAERDERINTIGNALVDAGKILLFEVKHLRPDHVLEEEWTIFQEKRLESLDNIHKLLVTEEDASKKELTDLKCLLESSSTNITPPLPSEEERRLRIDKFGRLIREAYTINLEGLKSFKTMGDRESDKVTLGCFEKMLANISQMDDIHGEELRELESE
jgi:hypothetical protein